MVALTSLALLGVGGLTLYVLYSVMSFIAHWSAVAGGIGIGLFALRYLLEERPIEVAEEELYDNVLYLAASIPLGVLSFRFLNGFLQGASILLTILVAVLAVVSVFYPAAMFQILNVVTVLWEEFTGGE